MLKVENISTGYEKKQVLFDVSFEVKQGEIVLLVGSNGSGKSTLLKTIYGLLPLWNKGQIFFDGENITDKPTAALLQKGLLYIPQKNNLFEDLTVKENLQMAGITLDQQILPHQIENVLSIFTALLPHLHRTPMKISGGERQLLTLAMATLHKPKMILVDEPYIALSPHNIKLVSGTLKLLSNKYGITFLVVEQRIKECMDISNRVISLKLGKVFSSFDVNSTFNIHDLYPVFV